MSRKASPHPLFVDRKIVLSSSPETAGEGYSICKPQERTWGEACKNATTATFSNAPNPYLPD